MLHHGGDKIVYLTCGAEEHLALAILHVFLDIERHCLSDTEILQSSGMFTLNSLAKVKKLSMAWREVNTIAV